MSSRMTINGKTYTGTNIMMKNGIVYVDGKAVDDKELQQAKTIIINGDVEKIESYGGDVNVTGDVTHIKTGAGDVHISGDAYGNIETGAGDVKIKGSKFK